MQGVNDKSQETRCVSYNYVEIVYIPSVNKYTQAPKKLILIYEQNKERANHSQLCLLPSLCYIKNIIMNK